MLNNLRDTNGFLVMEEKKMGFSKKKRFNMADARAMQTRINLKFPEMMNNSKRKFEDLLLFKKGKNLAETQGLNLDTSPFKEFEKQL